MESAIVEYEQPVNDVVTAQLMDGERGAVLRLSPTLAGVNLVEWAVQNRAFIDRALYTHGVILLRGFAESTAVAFNRFIATTSRQAAPYREPATPRIKVFGNVYTSTEYPPEHEIPLHNENSHCTSWPLKIYFMCIKPSETGGQTPFADCRRILQNIPQDVLAAFVERKWLYVRNFGSGMAFTWQKVFGTSSRDAVEAYCREHGMEFRWSGADNLRVRYTREAVKLHPVTGERLWFNHGLCFNPISLGPDLRDMLLQEATVDELAYNTFYGDGAPIEADVLALLIEAHRKETRYFQWQAGDILMLDNMLVAHGRKPFTGKRLILAGMSDSYPV